ncbi:MAG: hypothetical protein LAN71_17245 [Acidobacteriia bacterium]|nr:hypothetical protein [Terriglobia bacterium]
MKSDVNISKISDMVLEAIRKQGLSLEYSKDEDGLLIIEGDAKHDKKISKQKIRGFTQIIFDNLKLDLNNLHYKNIYDSLIGKIMNQETGKLQCTECEYEKQIRGSFQNIIDAINEHIEHNENSEHKPRFVFFVDDKTRPNIVVGGLSCTSCNVAINISGTKEEILDVVNDHIQTCKSKNIKFTWDFNGIIIDGKTSEPENISEEIRKEAGKIIKEGKIVEHLVKCAHKFHMGDDVDIEATYYSACTIKIKNSLGLHIDTVGDSGIGKSHVQKTVSFLMPDNAVISMSVSPKYLFYKEEFMGGTVLFMDDIDVDDELKAIIKRTTSNFHDTVKHGSIVNGDAKEFNIPPEIVYWVNYNYTSIDEAYNNRFLINSKHLTIEDRKNIANFMAERKKKGLIEFYADKDVRIMREIWNLLPNCYVMLPFEANDYYKIIKSWDLRDHNIISDMVTCSALLNYMNRVSKVISDKNLVITAEHKDILNAEKIWNFYFGHLKNVKNKDTARHEKLTRLETQIYDRLYEEGSNGMLQKDICKDLKKSDQNISRSLHALMNKLSDVYYQDETVPITNEQFDINGRVVKKTLIKTVRRKRWYAGNLNSDSNNNLSKIEPITEYTNNIISEEDIGDEIYE